MLQICIETYYINFSKCFENADLGEGSEGCIQGVWKVLGRRGWVMGAYKLLFSIVELEWHSSKKKSKIAQKQIKFLLFLMIQSVLLYS